MASPREIKEEVTRAFSKVALEANSNTLKDHDPQASFPLLIGYHPQQLSVLPKGAVRIAVGCGNPTALIEILEGETVLDLGSGAGIDVLLSAMKVGPSGKAIGIDISYAMVERAQENAAEANLKNAEFLLGDVEALPLDCGSIDVIISNASINLSPDKDAAFQESFRVLKPGGRMLICDTVTRANLSSQFRRVMETGGEWVLGLLIKSNYLQKIRNAGFQRSEVVRESDPEGRFPICSVSIRASKPAHRSPC